MKGKEKMGGVEGGLLKEKQLQRERNELLRGEEMRKPQWKAEGAL